MLTTTSPETLKINQPVCYFGYTMLIEPDFKKIAVLLPAFNESRKIGAVLSKLSQKFSNIIVVDDGSTDLTAQKAELAGALVLKNPSNKGKGSALRLGLSEALKDQLLDAVIVMDADGQHRPEDAVNLAVRWQKEKCDVIVGERRFRKPMTHARIFWNTLISKLFSLTVGQTIPDSQCGLRLYSKETIHKVLPEPKGYVAESEMLAKAVLAGAKISRVPISTIYENPAAFNPIKDLPRVIAILFFVFKLFLEKKIGYRRLFFALILTTVWFLMYRVVAFDIATAKNRYAAPETDSSGYISAMNVLHDNSNRDAIVISEWTQGHQVVALAGRRAVATPKVYPSEAKELAGRFRDIGKFFFSISDNEAKEILDKYNASYVFLRKKDFDFFLCEYNGRCGNTDALIYKLLSGETLSFLEPIYETDLYKILKVTDVQGRAFHYTGFEYDYGYFNSELKEKEQKSISSEKNKIVGGIISHHYPFVDAFFPEFFARLQRINPSVTVIIGPDHNNISKIHINFSERFWLTPLGVVKPEEGLIQKLIYGYGATDEKAHQDEWSVKTIIPYIAAALPETKIVPIIIRSDVSAKETEKFGRYLAEILPYNAVVIVSANFAHKLSADETAKKDKESMDAIENLAISAVPELEVDAKPALITLFSFLRERGATNARILGHETNETLREKDPAHFPEYPYIVSYLSYVFEK